MKRISPLELLKNRKIRKYEEGSPGVEYSNTSPAILDAIANLGSSDIQAAEANIEPAPEYDFTTPSVDPNQSDSGGIGDILAWLAQSSQGSNQATKIDPNSIMALSMMANASTPNMGAIAAAQPAATTSSGDSSASGTSSTGGLGQWIQSQLSGEQKTPAQRMGVSEEAYAEMVKKEPMIAAIMAAQQKNEPSTFSKMLQLGLVGMGGLASYKDAKDKNKALEKAYARNEAQNAGYDRFAQQVNLGPGGYSGPATQAFATKNISAV